MRFLPPNQQRQSTEGSQWMTTKVNIEWLETASVRRMSRRVTCSWRHVTSWHSCVHVMPGTCQWPLHTTTSELPPTTTYHNQININVTRRYDATDKQQQHSSVCRKVLTLRRNQRITHTHTHTIRHTRVCQLRHVVKLFSQDTSK